MKHLHVHASADNLAEASAFIPACLWHNPPPAKPITPSGGRISEGKKTSPAAERKNDITMTDKTYNILFLCTGNSARSIMAEALVTTLSQGRFIGYSAGSKPGGKVNPFAIEQVKKTGYPVENLRSKSWDEFASPGAPHMDFIITVCDNAAGEACPVWPGHPATAHWGFEDPAAVEGSDEQKRAAFEKIYRQIMGRMQTFLSLPVHMLEKHAIKQEIEKIGATPVSAS